MADPDQFLSRIESAAARRTRVAEILSLIDRLPGRSDTPLPTSPPTPAGVRPDGWFDGGYYREITGWTEFYFDDGARAETYGFASNHTDITLACGQRVVVKECD